MPSIIERIDLPPESFVARYISFASSLTDAPLEFHLGAGLTALATACGSKIIYPGYGGRRQWPNLYTLLIAPSGLYRKSTSVGIAEDLIADVDTTLILSGEQSREKFLALLKEAPNVLYPISEFASVLSMWARDYAQGFKEIVVDLFDCRQEYSRQTLGGGKLAIRRPALNILAASTLDWLKEKLTEGDLRGGLMGRFIIFPGEVKTSDPGLRIDYDLAAKAKLITYLGSIRHLKEASVDVGPVLEDYRQWVRKAEGIMSKQFNPELLGFQSRLASHALKLMVLLRVSDEPEPLPKYILQKQDLERAILLSKWLIDQASILAETSFIKSKTEQLIQKLLALASRNGGIQRNDAVRCMHISSKLFDSIVQTAVERSEMKVEKETPGHQAGRTAIFYTTIPRPETP